LLLTGQLDMAVLNLPLGEPELRVLALFEEELILVVPTDHRLATGTDPVSLRDLAGEDLLLGPPGTILRKDIDAVAADIGIELRARAEVDGVRLIASLAFIGFAPTIVPATAIPGWVTTPNWATRPIKELLRRRVGLAIPRRGLPSAPADAVRTTLLTVIREVGAKVPGIHLLD
jgi:DNA-binding transcriptional LysR family regulator